MKTNVLRFALFPLLALSALPLSPSAFAQGTVSLPLGNIYKVQYSTDDGTTVIPIPVGNPAQVPGWGQLNIEVYYASVGTALPFFSPWSISLMPAAWTESSTPPLHQIIANAGWTPATTFTLPTATGGANVEVTVVGWTGPYADWNSALTAYTGLFGWSGSYINGGALAWQNGTGNPNASPPTTPVALTTGAVGYDGLVLWRMPEPSTFALAGLGAVMLFLFHRRR